MLHLLSRLTTVAVVFAVAGSASCGRSPLSPGTSNSTTTSRTYSWIGVEVEDALSRLISGVTVVVVDGPRAGTTMVTNVLGDSSLPGPFDASAPVTLRISKDGLIAKTQTVTLSGFGVSAYLRLQMESVDNVQISPGEYTLTVTPNEVCPNLPADFRSRSYAAAVSPPPSDSPSRYRVTLTPAGAVDLFVAGRDVGIPGTNGDFVHLAFEQLASSATFLITVYGLPVTSVGASIVSALDLPVRGSFLYCDTQPGSAQSCSQCYFDHGQVALARK